MASNSTLNLMGRIEKTDLPTLLRTVEKDKLSGELGFGRQGGEKINLYFLFGQLYHSTWGKVTGIDAVSELLGWKSGTYAFTEGIIPAQASINDDIDRILASSPHVQKPLPQTGALRPAPMIAPPPMPNPYISEGGYDDSLAPFDLASLNTPAPKMPLASFAEQNTPTNTGGGSPYDAMTDQFDLSAFQHSANLDERHAPEPPADGIYRTRYFCLPAGEQMATSLVATGPQLEEELLHLAEVSFTGYVLGAPEVEGFPAVGICLLKGRFIHAFYHLNTAQGLILLEGERAYRAALDQKGASAARFYWFYEITTEAMRAAIALLTPPTRYSHLEVRIVRFKEFLRMLSEESHTGCVRITVPATPKGQGVGETACIPIFKGSILGLWTMRAPRLTNDGQMLQHFLNEPQAYLDLHATAPVSDPGLPLESLINLPPAEASPLEQVSGIIPREMLKSSIPPAVIAQTQSQNYAQPAPETVAPVDDDERQLRLITAISRMESTYTQAQRKERLEYHAALLMLSGFANDVVGLSESVSGRRGVIDMVNRALKQELQPFRSLFQTLDLQQGRVNLVKLLKELDLFSKDGEQAGNDYYRETSKALRTLIRGAFQNYVSMIRKESVRFECQEMYEIFLQEVVKRI